ncbi:MAG: outer membrane beta-barrel protein [Candidatus Eisenbacteria bacterium]|nr:outer membrane beta-barrel protein [Candidatus Eisenbacteria bacterium]
MDGSRRIETRLVREMRCRLGLGIALFSTGWLIAEAAQPGVAAARTPAGPGKSPLQLFGQLATSIPAGRAGDDWDLATGVGLGGIYRVAPTWDVRLDTGARWYDGSGRAIDDAERPPRWGARQGELTEGLRVIPTTFGLVRRFEGWSDGRFWIPYAGFGPGLYDMQATFRDTFAEERKHNLFRFGWHARAGVQLQRTSGMFINFETAAHAVDVPGKWSTLFDLNIGVGAQLSAR